MTIHDVEVNANDGSRASLSDYGGKALLVVNVASKCGLTPQYMKLEQLQETYGDRGFTVLAFPSNQFLQELNSSEAIATFCSQTYGVTFPMFAKLDVKGANQHPLYAILSQCPDGAGKAGNVAWNFEKFLVDKDGHVVRRFRSKVEPASPEVVKAIESLL